MNSKSRTIDDPDYFMEIFIDFLIADPLTSDTIGHYENLFPNRNTYAPRVQSWRLSKTSSLNLNLGYLFRFYKQFCFYYAKAAQQPIPNLDLDQDSFLDEFLTLVPIVQYNYITQTVTFPSHSQLRKFIEEEYEHDTDNTTRKTN